MKSICIWSQENLYPFDRVAELKMKERLPNYGAKHFHLVMLLIACGKKGYPHYVGFMLKF
jgi:hypothetical protein